jgi:hypothetical protein
MSDWSDNVIAKLNQKREHQRLRDAKFVEEQKIKRANGVPLWRELKEIRQKNLWVSSGSGSLPSE